MFKGYQILTARSVIYQMRNKQLLTICVLVTVLAVVASATDVNHSEECPIPEGAEVVLSKALPGWSVVTKSDLTEHDRALWFAKHSRACPGVAAGYYFGTGGPGYAVTLIKHEATRMLQTLVALKPDDHHSYELIELSKPQEASRALVVFKLKPGAFEDIETGRTVKTNRDSVAYEDIAAGMLVYDWQNGKFNEIQTSE